MALDATAVERILAGTDLIGLPVADGPGGTLLVDGIHDRNLLRLWRAARSVVERTGRWPVAVTTAFSGSIEAEVGAPSTAELDELQLMAEHGDPWPAAWEPDPVEDDELFLHATTPGGLDLSDDAARELTFPVPEPVLDRWIYDRVRAYPTRRARELSHVGVLATTGYWFEPGAVTLALLPTPKQWLAPGWVSYFGALGPDSWRLAAALYQWEQRWGAGLVASWGTMLQLVPQRRPADGDEAWQLAGELKRLGGSLQMHRWELALAVAQGDAWFLHDRP